MPSGRRANVELISSAHNPVSFRWVPRKGAVAGRSQRRLFFVHSFGVYARDRDIGNAESNRTTAIRSTKQVVQPKIDLGAVGIRFGHQWHGGYLYTAVFRYSVAKCQQFGRTASAPASFRSDAGSGCRRFEGHSVGPAAARHRATGQWLLVAANHSSAFAGF